jgi:SAM-dependent methyltransferase
MAPVSGSTNAQAADSAPVAVSALTRLTDSLAGEVVLRHVPGCRVLDLGYGSPEVAQWVQQHAVERLCIVEKEALDAPSTGAAGAEDPLVLDELADESFDLVYSLRTFPHLGEDAESSERLARELLAEAARVTLPGGTILVEIANPRSLRGILDGIRNPITVVAQRGMVVEDAVRSTRYDTLARFRSFVPRELDVVDVHGLGVLVPHGTALEIPILGSLLGRLEWMARDSTLLSHFGAQLLVVLRKLTRAQLPADRSADLVRDLSTTSLVAVKS